MTFDLEHIITYYLMNEKSIAKYIKLCAIIESQFY